MSEDNSPSYAELVSLLRQSIERKPMLADTYHRIKAALAKCPQETWQEKAARQAR